VAVPDTVCSLTVHPGPVSVAGGGGLIGADTDAGAADDTAVTPSTRAEAPSTATIRPTTFIAAPSVNGGGTVAVGFDNTSGVEHAPGHG
jgi:hypothetical protein